MADVSILDIAGSQWDFKDTKARDAVSKIGTYSTSEIKTSKTWINGKPIYRKVFIPMIDGVIQQGYSYSGDNWYGFTELQSVDMVVDGRLLNKRIDGFVDIYNSCTAQTSQALVPQVGSNRCYLNFHNKYSIFIILEYTKISD